MRRVMCGTPANECIGSFVPATAGLQHGCKMHGTHEEALRCHKAWLLRQGYKPLSAREFVDPKTNSVLVLTKAIRFGASMRMGKGLEGKGSRVVPKKRGKLGGALGGVII